MDVRVRWLLLEKPASSFMLELLACFLVIGAMTLTAALGVPRIAQHLYVLDAVFLSSAPITDMMESHAVTGAWPTSNARGPVSAAVIPARSLSGTEAIREGGAFDYTLFARGGTVSEKILTFRAWQNSGDSGLPVAWRCGHARAPPLIAAGSDKTTLTDDELPSPCRARN
jgi:type IV pilus assembly protein PilA